MLNLYYVTLSFGTDESVSETLVGPVVGLSDAHDMIVNHIDEKRARIKAAWLKTFDFEWPGNTDINLKMTMNGESMVIHFDSDSGDSWYEIKA